MPATVARVMFPPTRQAGAAADVEPRGGGMLPGLVVESAERPAGQECARGGTDDPVVNGRCGTHTGRHAGRGSEDGVAEDGRGDVDRPEDPVRPDAVAQ